MKGVIFDMDDTLFLNTWTSKKLMRISQWFMDIAYRFQKLNKPLLDKYDGYQIGILTGRNFKYFQKATARQLKNITVNFIMMPDKDKLVRNMKREQIKILRKQGYKNWEDDEKCLIELKA